MPDQAHSHTIRLGGGDQNKYYHPDFKLIVEVPAPVRWVQVNASWGPRQSLGKLWINYRIVGIRIRHLIFKWPKCWEINKLR